MDSFHGQSVFTDNCGWSVDLGAFAYGFHNYSAIGLTMYVSAIVVSAMAT